MEKQLSGSAKRKLKRSKELKLVANFKTYSINREISLRKDDDNAEIPPSPASMETANANVSASSPATTSVEASSETWNNSEEQ